MVPSCLDWGAAGALRVLDQTLLPAEERWLELRTAAALVEAIRSLRVRGAPAIGVAAAMGIAAFSQRLAGEGRERFLDRLERDAELVASARPTAVNLRWAVDRVLGAARSAIEGGASTEGALAAVRREADAILADDRAACRAMGEHGQALMRQGIRVLTHCNTGALATAGIGTALAVVYVAHERGLAPHVWVDETRPLLQGSRLTAWELSCAGVSHAVLPDVAAASLMRNGKVDLVLVGADRIARNGDVANKVGTHALALAARHYEVPFYVVAPASTHDDVCPDGGSIPIEERDASEVTSPFGRAVAPSETPVYNPAFDVTPAGLVTGYISERGLTETRTE